MECGICYAYRLNDLIPDKACDDSRCGQPFHSLCLYEVIILESHFIIDNNAYALILYGELHC